MVEDGCQLVLAILREEGHKGMVSVNIGFVDMANFEECDELVTGRGDVLAFSNLASS